MAGSENEHALGATWNRQMVGAHFDQEATITEPNKHGHEGYRLLIPPTDDPRAAVTVFPDSAHIRVQTRHGDVHLRHALPPRLTTSGMYVETEDGSTQLLVTKDGGVALQAFPDSTEPRESPTETSGAHNAVMVSSEEKTLPRASGDEIRPSGELVATAETTGGNEKQKTVKWTGYVSTDPRFSGTDENPRANFVVSEKVEIDGEEKTVFHKCYTTKKEALRLLHAGLTKGQHVQVSGYPQAREVKKPDGKVVQEPRVYANHVRLLGGNRRDTQTPDASDSAAARAVARPEDAGSGTIANGT